MEPTNPFDRPAILAIISVIYIQVMEIITAIPAAVAFLFQVAIGTLTVIYLVHKIKHIRKLNKTVFNHEQEERTNNE